MHRKHSHDLNEVMTKRSLVSHDNNNQVSNGSRYNPNGNFHESSSHSSVKPLKKDFRGKDTLVPSRRLIALVNNDSTFIEAQRHLGLFPQVAYKLVRDAGVARVKQVTDFILSLALETPYFQVDKFGKYDPSHEGQRDRARKMLINIALTNKPILEKYAGPSYFKKWPKDAC